jgi:hypothetical protein
LQVIASGVHDRTIAILGGDGGMAAMILIVPSIVSIAPKFLFQSLFTIQVLMDHSNTKTTKAYYCHKRQNDGIREAKQVFKAKICYPDVIIPKLNQDTC